MRVRNAYDFLDLSHLTLEWRLVADGVVVQSGTLAEPLDLPAGESRELTLPCDAGRVRPDQEGFLELSFKLRDEQPWAPRGHEVAWEQIALPRPGGIAGSVVTPVPPALEVRRDGARVVVASPDFEAAIEGGSLVSYRWKGEERLAGPARAAPVARAHRQRRGRWSGELRPPVARGGARSPRGRGAGAARSSGCRPTGCA